MQAETIGLAGEPSCPMVHSHQDHLACRYGGAYYHGIIRALWWSWMRELGRAVAREGGEGE